MRSLWKVRSHIVFLFQLRSSSALILHALGSQNPDLASKDPSPTKICEKERTNDVMGLEGDVHENAQGALRANLLLTNLTVSW